MRALASALIVAATWYVVPTIAQASLVDRGSFTTDTTSNLDWLDVTATLGQSYDQVSAGAYVASGWRYATAGEVLSLFNDAGADQNCYIGCNSQLSYAPARLLIQLLGYSYDGSNADGVTLGVQGLMSASVYAGTHDIAQFQFNQYLTGSSPNTGIFIPNNGGIGDWFSSGTIGSLLVRDASSSIPEPDSVALVAVAGLLGLALRPRRQSGLA